MKLLPFRIFRLLIACGIAALNPSLVPAERALPRAAREAYRALRAASTKNLATMIAELRATMESHAQLRAAEMATLGDIPLIVLSHGQPQRVMGMPDDVNQAYEQTWQELQAELATLSPQGKLIVARESGHYIQLDQPELVIDAVQEVVEAARLRLLCGEQSERVADAVA
jgi:pimeloyl-ACP methyl ester carboxylesterase